MTKHCPNCKGELTNTDSYPNDFFCGGCKKIYKIEELDEKPKKEVEFTEPEKNLIKKKVEEKDLIEDDDVENLKKLKKESNTNSTIFAKLFLTAWDYLHGNLYAFYEKDNEDMKKLHLKLRGHLNTFQIEKLRNLLEEYNDGNNFGSNFKKMDIKEYSKKYHQKMDNLIQLFFQCFGGDE